MSEENPSPIKLSWIIGILAAFTIFAVIGAYSSRMAHDHPDFYDQQAATRFVTLAKLREENKKTLTTADWIDQGKKIVRIPIDEAMTEEVETLKSEPAQMGCEIPVATPASAPASTNAAPAAAASPATNAPPANPTPPAKPKK